MSVNAQYTLSANVQLIPVTAVAEQTRKRFEHREDDFVITCSNARNTSKIIDHDSAALLQEFKKPASLAEGIFKYSFVHKLNPQETLEKVYPFLLRLRNEGFLVTHDAAAANPAESLLQSGSLEGYEIVEKLQGISDTEVYKIKKEDKYFAVKILKTEGLHTPLAAQFHHEIKVLEHLKGSPVGPELVEENSSGKYPYMVMEFIEGLSCEAATAQHRNLHSPENLLTILSVCIKILAAYETLHAANIIHADVHPRNILVDQNRNARIIDYGLARMEQGPSNPVRGGIGFFFEPEYATALQKQQPVPPASYAGEQYALAALCYSLLTGKQYLNFSFEKDALLDQIVHEPPVPFRACDIDIPDGIEAAIFKALSKAPQDRHASVAVFKEALQRVHDRLSRDDPKEITLSDSAFCDKIKQRFGWHSPFLETGLQLGPKSSVNYGAAGIAYMFYRMGLVEADAGWLTVADLWINKAYDYLQDSEAAFYAPAIDITEATVGHVSIYHSASGVHLVQALISKAMGDVLGHQRAVQNFIVAASGTCENPDLTLGKSGLLIGCALLTAGMEAPSGLLWQELHASGDHIMQEIWTEIDAYQPISGTGPITYNGIAHGWAGILYATLRWCRQSKSLLPGSFFERVGQLLEIGKPEEDRISWSVTCSNPTSWTGWCSGSAGYTFLWSELYAFTRDARYLETAEKTVRHFLSDTQVSTESLCCGTAGKCYALLNMYRVAGNDLYLQEARQLARRMLKQAYLPENRNNSLYKGDIGLATLFTELRQPRLARMPLFE